MTRRVVVLGVGNILLTDEGVGVHAVNALAEQFCLPDEVEVIDGGTSGMDCLDRIAEADLLLIADCMRGKRAPGTITRLGGEQIGAFFKTRISPHQVGLSDVFATLALHELSPKAIVMLGVEPKAITLGMDLSSEVSAILPDLVGALAAELVGFGVSVHPKAA